ncbi:MAG: hypothetical protein DRR16_12915 [Candidatus Parabeggiatoa sp. nov. 3]|nr:MAG: hypothetical protein DRR00_18455 [Gammaproteobacteria bacterium]RKZ64695.1 MAG: hypothetical protein DRQ99_14985 [Gammaproteobacteria bacterium]RKZ85086.1 MAG: hypothetical protein DRR16_12915 [Gammaproteobacteria bacterium]
MPHQCISYYAHIIGIVFVLIFVVSCGSTNIIRPPDQPPDRPDPPFKINSPKPPQPEQPFIMPQKATNKLLVVSMANGLNQHGKTIQKTLHERLNKHLNARLPFTLLTLDPKEVKNPFSNWSDINDTRTLWKKISAIRFGYSLDALANLKRINNEYQGFKKLLYFTDNGNMDDIDPSALTVPQSWQQANIELTVLTTGSCTPWTKQARVHQCTKLDDEDDIEKALHQFVSQ